MTRGRGRIERWTQGWVLPENWKGKVCKCISLILLLIEVSSIQTVWWWVISKSAILANQDMRNGRFTILILKNNNHLFTVLPEKFLRKRGIGKYVLQRISKYTAYHWSHETHSTISANRKSQCIWEFKLFSDFGGKDKIKTTVLIQKSLLFFSFWIQFFNFFWVSFIHINMRLRIEALL